MNNFRWMKRLMNTGRKRRFFAMNRQNNRGRMGMFLTLLGVGAGAAWYGLAQGRDNNKERSSRSLVNMPSAAKAAMPSTETAFAEELLQEVTSSTNKKEHE
ncbi:hypothetical protein [Bacillus piscicola]|uniref:hypothetical protein n=1 Tax=Bacillus piscicola TaxID=1632684 RepID=UPI001F08E62A|nr:hypothetical protein [Bacillus piscicola]